MKPSHDFQEFLDLSFLSAEEEAAILKVLQRDEDLKKNDTGRVRRLKATTPDPQQLRVMTGEWFEDLKAKRYGELCDITTVVKSSMRKKKTSAPKINPFMNYAATEGRGDKDVYSKHLPAFTEERYRKYTDEDFSLYDEPTSSEINEQKSPRYQQKVGEQSAGKSTNPFLSTHTPVSTAADPGNHSPGVNHLPPAENKSFTFMQPQFKTASTEDAVKPEEPSTMVALPPALRKGASVEDGWVKISVEPNMVTQSDLKHDRSLSATGNAEHGETEAHSSCSSDTDDQSEFQSRPHTPTEPVLLHYNQNVSDDVNISHASERPVPSPQALLEKIADSNRAKRAVPKVSSSLSSTTEQMEKIRYEVASCRSLSPKVASCSGSTSAEVNDESHSEMEATEISLKKQPRMDFSYELHGTSRASDVTHSEVSANIEAFSINRGVDRDEKESPSQKDLHSSVYIFGKMDSKRFKKEFKKETQQETGSENTASGVLAEPTQLNKVSLKESHDSSMDISESIEHTRHEQPEDKLLDSGRSSEIEYKIPKPSTHSFLVVQARDEMLSSDLSGSQLGDGHGARQNENKCVRESLFEVCTKEDELGINRRHAEIKTPAAQTVVPQHHSDQMEPGETHSSALTTSGSAAGTVAVANTATNDGLGSKIKLSSELDLADTSTEGRERQKQAQFVVRPLRAYAAVPVQPSDDHMTSGPDSRTPSQEVPVGQDKWALSARFRGVRRDMVEDAYSAAPGVDEEETTELSTRALPDKNLDITDVVELKTSEPPVTELFKETHSEEGRQDSRGRNADLPETTESVGFPSELQQGNPFESAVGDVHVSEEAVLTPEHVSSSVDVHPLRPEDQPAPSVQLGNGNYKIPAIVIMPSESQQSGENKDGEQKPTPAQAETEGIKGIIASPVEWEDDALDSDDDQSSVSSYGSDLSARKSHLSNALSVSGRTGSLMSIYSDAGDFGNVVVQGAVEFAMMYSPAEELIIMVEQCQDLAYGNTRKQRTDPYVKTYLIPDKFRRTKRKTSIKKHTNNPVYVESLRYKIKKKDLLDKTLNLSVWHNDSRGRNVFLGKVELNLKTWDWGHEALTWYNLQPKGGEGQESKEYRGTLFVALKYMPPVSSGGSKQTTGEVHVWLKEAKDLCQIKSHNVDSFVKCYMLPDTSKKSRQKTRVVKKNQSPVYNHAMVFDGFRAGEVREACCELTAWDHNKLSNQFLGGVRLSSGTGESYGKKVDWMDSVNQEVEIWERMLAQPNNWVEGVLPLRSSMTPRK